MQICAFITLSGTQSAAGSLLWRRPPDLDEGRFTLMGHTKTHSNKPNFARPERLATAEEDFFEQAAEAETDE